MPKQKALPTTSEIIEAIPSLLTQELLDIKKYVWEELDQRAAKAKAEISLISGNDKL